MRRTEAANRAKALGPVAAGAAVMLALTSVASVGETCQVDTCFERTDRALPAQGARVPANLQGVFWKSPSSGSPGMAGEYLEGALVETGGGGGEREIEVETTRRLEPYTFEFQFEEPLTPGQTYEVRGVDSCTVWRSEGRSRLAFGFETTEEALLPTGLGALEVVQTKTGFLQVESDGPCDEVVRAAQAEIELRLSDEAKPWEDALWFETYVDGRRWRGARTAGENIDPGQSWIGRGRDRIYAQCGGGLGLDEGIHTVEIRGYLPGVEDAVISEEIEVVLECRLLGGCGGGCYVSGSGAPGPNKVEISLMMMMMSLALIIAAARRVCDGLIRAWPYEFRRGS